MSDEIAQVVEQDVAQPMLKAVEDIGETVPSHFEGIGERLEGAATAHLENETGIVSDIQGISPGAVESETAGAVESATETGAGDLSASGEVPSEPLSEGSPVTDAQPPGGQGASDDPVDLVTGEMYLPQRDLALPGVLALIVERTHRSGYRRGRWFGRSWASTLDQRIEVDDDGIHYAAPDGVVLHYPVPQQPGQKMMPAEGARWPLSWDKQADTIRIEQPERGHTLHFPPGPTPAVCRPLAALTDRNDNRITFVHDDDGIPTDVYHSGGYHILIDRDFTPAGPRITGLALADSRGGSPIPVRRFGYDPAGRLTDLVDSSELPQVFEYDDQDRMTSWADRNGYRYEYHYDEGGRVVRADGTGGYLAAVFGYDLEAGTTTLTDSLGHATVHHWNERGQVYKVVDPLGGVTLTEQDRFNRLISRTDPLGHTSRWIRNGYGDPIRVERPDGTSVQATYNELRLPERVTDADGAVWQYAYDERGNLTSITDPDGGITRREYDDHGALVATIDALGGMSRFECDRAGLPVSAVGARGARGIFERNGFGLITAMTDATGATTRMEWTVEGRPVSRQAPDGSREQWLHDAEGNLLEYRDAAGNVTAYEYGPFDKPTARTDPSGSRHRFAYDTELRLTSVTNAAGLAWRYEYDATDNLLSETDFNGRTLTYSYDAAGQLAEQTNGAGQTMTFVRDPMGRIVERQAADGVHRFVHDAAGRLVRAENNDSVLEYTRDALGRILVEKVDGRALENAYDLLGRRTKRTTPTGAASQWSYDAAGMPTALTTDAGGLTFQYDELGRETIRYLGPGAALSQGFDSQGRLTGQAVWAYDRPGDAASARLVQERTFAYRADSVPLEIVDHERRSRRHDLDRLGRITAIHAATWSEAYAYDAMGNVVHAAEDREYGGTLIRRAGRTSYEHDGQGRIVRTTRRTLSGQTKQWTYTWAADDRLTEVSTPDGHTWYYSYDPLGRRVAKRRLDQHGAVAEETRFCWDGVRLAEEVSIGADGRTTAVSWDWEPDNYRAAAQTRRSWAADAPQAEIDTAFYAIVTDLAGTPTELVAPDGVIAWRSTTGLWGNPVPSPQSETDCPLRFPGQYRDAETGLHYNYFRYYDPEAATYASPDPLGLAPAPNHHAYVDNPLTLADPLGLGPYDDPNQVFVRRGTSWESTGRLNSQAQAAEAADAERFGHGVSVTTPESNARLSSNPDDASTATRQQIEDAGFTLKHSPTKADPSHHTLQLPDPVTPDVARKFNELFGRSRK